MKVQLDALCFDAEDPAAVARFWAGLLGRVSTESAGHVAGAVDVPPEEPMGIRLRFVTATAPRVAPNRLHLHVTSQSPADQDATVARAVELGARHLDVEQLPEEGHVVLSDPGGNEFCVIEPGNRFLAECGFLAEVTCDGSRAVGRFWSEALGWPLVWDQDEETAIRSPRGGPKITWGGPPVNPKRGENRLHFDLAPPAGGDQQAEVDRLVGLGASRTGSSPHEAGGVAMTDPDGNELCVLAS